MDSQEPSEPERNLERLLERAARGDSRAIDELLSGQRTRLRQMVNVRMDARLQARIDPSDVVQEALMVASQKLEGYLESQPVPFYLGYDESRGKG